jgi:hypothetical protein
MSEATCDFVLVGESWVCQSCGLTRPKRPHGIPPKSKCNATSRAIATAEKTKPARHAKGPGNYLASAITFFFGESAKPSCGCKSRLYEMNAKGPWWCLRNINTITGWLMEEGEKRKMLDSRLKRLAAPWACRAMILGAIGRSMADALKRRQMRSTV